MKLLTFCPYFLWNIVGQILQKPSDYKYDFGNACKHHCAKLQNQLIKWSICVQISICKHLQNCRLLLSVRTES